MTNRIILATICLVLAVATNEINAQEKGFRNREIGSIIYLDVPEYMTKTIGLNDIAKAQFSNAEKEAYLIIIDEAKDDIELAGGTLATSKEYFKFFIESFGLDSIHVISEHDSNAGDFPAYQAQIDGMVQNMNLFYLITIIESQTHFYNIISWTLMENKDKLINDFKKIPTSLKEN